MATTKIEWADAVWNPVTGCTPISEGCDHCYARRMANRLKGRAGYPSVNPFQVTIHPERLEDPLKLKTPKRIFVCSMGDLFHPDVPLSATKDVFDVMRRAGNLFGHTFMILTKRPRRMALFIELLQRDKGPDFKRWPLPFVWLGVTAENQKRADERRLILLQIQAAVRFVSVEPMLGPVDLTHIPIPRGLVESYGGKFDPVNWVIAGGETGPGARPMHPDWVRSLRDQCRSAGVPFFFKQWGEWKPIGQMADGESDTLAEMIEPSEERPFGGTIYKVPTHTFGVDDDVWINGQPHTMFRTGKKAAGRLLDGREWNEFLTGGR